MSNSPKGTDVLPAEIWIHIFDQFYTRDDLTIDDESSLKPISLTCRAFHSIVLPHLFSKFAIRPYVFHLLSSQIFTLPPKELKKQTGKLEFYVSERIAGYVRAIYLTPIIDNAAEPTLETTPMTASRDVRLLHHFFEMIPKFENVRSIKASDIDFDGFALRQLSQVLTLQDLCIEGCKLLSPGEISLSLKKFRLLESQLPKFDSKESVKKGMENWLAVVGKEKLEVLELSHRVFMHGPFPSLLDISLTTTTDVLCELSLVLSQSPRLRALNLYPPLFGAGAARLLQLLDQFKGYRVVLPPSLVEFRGPFELFRAALDQPVEGGLLQQLRQLKLVPFLAPGEDFATIWTQLSSPKFSAQLEFLTEFQVSFQFIENDHFLQLLKSLVNVEELILEASNPWAKVTTETFLDELCSHCSSSSKIRYLAVEWTAAADIDVKAKHECVQEKLAMRLPLLRELWICDWMRAALIWKQDASGIETLVEHDTGTSRLAQEARKSRSDILSF